MIVRARDELMSAVLGHADGPRPASPQDPILAWDGRAMRPMNPIPKTQMIESTAQGLPLLGEMVPAWLAAMLVDGPVVFLESDEWNDLDPMVQGQMDIIKY